MGRAWEGSIEQGGAFLQEALESSDHDESSWMTNEAAVDVEAPLQDCFPPLGPQRTPAA